MKQVAPLHYDVIFKKAFSVPEVFNAFVCDFLKIAGIAKKQVKEILIKNK